jgi:hypothetical protein
MVATSMEEIERESLKDLNVLVEKSKEWQIDLTIIGGYAVRAYTNAYRHTKDIDMAVSKEQHGNFLALLKSLHYTPRSAEFGVAASKKFDSDFIDVHISVGRILDISTGLHYPITPELFSESRIMMVRPKFNANKQFETKSPVVDLNTLLVLKFMPRGRPEKDGVDIISLLLDRSQEIDMPDIVKKCDSANLATHILSQIQDFAKNLRDGEMEKVWSDVTAARLTGTQTRDIQKFLRELDKAVRGR